jgi:hypothetical protein
MGKSAEKPKATHGAKRLAIEIAPAVRVMLDNYITAFNANPDRAMPPVKYTDVINQAIDEYLKTINR